MELVAIKVDRLIAANLRRKAKNLKIDPHVLVDLTAQFLLSSLQERTENIPEPRGRMRVNSESDGFDDTTFISKHIAKEVHPYAAYFDVSLSRLISEALSKMGPNITRLLPINCRSMSSLRATLFKLENGREYVHPAEASKKRKAALIAETLGPEEDFEIINV